LLAAATIIPHRRAQEASPPSSVPCEQTAVGDVVGGQENVAERGA
jgi:hypothetical protein